MCRHLAWLGPPRILAALLLEPEHSLLRQSWAPRRQRYGKVNADGYGVGWYVPGHEPAVQFRRAQPMWTDRSFAALAPTVAASCVLAAVRSATPPYPVEESATAPFATGRWLFSHNGAVPADSVRPLLPADAVPESSVDSALLWALLLVRLRAGDTPAQAVTDVVCRVAAVAPDARLNLLVTDGRTVAGSAWGDTLSVRAVGGGHLLASEPDDDDPSWVGLPDRTLTVLDETGATTIPLTSEESS